MSEYTNGGFCKNNYAASVIKIMPLTMLWFPVYIPRNWHNTIIIQDLCGNNLDIVGVMRHN